MDFITGLPKTVKLHDGIIVVINKLSKVASFIPMKSTHKAVNIVDIFMREIYRLHKKPTTIILDKDSKFTSNLWKELSKVLSTQLNFSTAYYPQIYE